MDLKEILLLKNLLDLLSEQYPEKVDNFVRNKHHQILPTYYRNKLEAYQVEPTNKYILVEIYKFIFFTLFSQNTSDAYTYKVAQVVSLKLLELNYNDAESLVNFLSDYFYKHKKGYTLTLRALGILISTSLKENKPVTWHELTQISRVGYKTAAILYNHFFTAETYPVVDVNVYRAYNYLMPAYLKKNAEKVFLTLTGYEQFVEESFNHEGYKLGNLLWYHRKLCRLRHCTTDKNFCEKCLRIRAKMNDFYNQINKKIL